MNITTEEFSKEDIKLKYNKFIPINACNLTCRGLPSCLNVKLSSYFSTITGIFTMTKIEKGSVFGPFIGKRVEKNPEGIKFGHYWPIYSNEIIDHYIDASDADSSNWMRYINYAPSSHEITLEAFQCIEDIYFRVIRDLSPNEELFVGICKDFIQSLEPSNLISDTNTTNWTEKGMLKIKKEEEETNENEILENSYSESNIDRISRDESEYSSSLDVCSRVNQYSKKYTSGNKTLIKKFPSITEEEILAKTISQMSRRKTYSNAHRNDLKCPICDKTFAKNTHLIAHSKLIHANAKAYKCDLCQKFFGTNSLLTRHTFTHKSEKPYKCDLCNRMFIESYAFREHLRKYHSKLKDSIDKKYKCSLCTQSFDRIIPFKEHLNVAHSDDGKLHNCVTCGETFTKKNYLRAHVRKIHARAHKHEKPFKCDECAKSFACYDYFKLHKRIHAGIQAFKCHVCDKPFIKKSHLTVHLRRHELLKEDLNRVGLRSKNRNLCIYSFKRISKMRTSNGM